MAERDFLELVALFFDIAYYSAMGRDKEAYLRTFTVIDHPTISYVGYVGSIDYPTSEIIGKIQERIERSRYP